MPPHDRRLLRRLLLVAAVVGVAWTVARHAPPRRTTPAPARSDDAPAATGTAPTSVTASAADAVTSPTREGFEAELGAGRLERARDVLEALAMRSAATGETAEAWGRLDAATAQAALARGDDAAAGAALAALLESPAPRRADLVDAPVHAVAARRLRTWEEYGGGDVQVADLDVAATLRATDDAQGPAAAAVARGKSGAALLAWGRRTLAAGNTGAALAMARAAAQDAGAGAAAPEASVGREVAGGAAALVAEATAALAWAAAHEKTPWLHLDDALALANEAARHHGGLAEVAEQAGRPEAAERHVRAWRDAIATRLALHGVRARRWLSRGDAAAARAVVAHARREDLARLVEVDARLPGSALWLQAPPEVRRRVEDAGGVVAARATLARTVAEGLWRPRLHETFALDVAEEETERRARGEGPGR
jgi:hypothetical protein